MGTNAQIKFDVVPWDAQAEDELTRIADAPDHLDSWRKAWAEGRAQVWAMSGARGRIGCVLWEIIWHDGAPQVHVLAASGQDPQRGATVALLNAFAALGRAVGAASVYCETQRAGMVRRLTANGCAAVQIDAGKWGITYVQ